MQLQGINPQKFKELITFGYIKELLVAEMKFLKLKRLLKETKITIFLVSQNEDIFKLVENDLKPKMQNPLDIDIKELAKVAPRSMLLFYESVHLHLAELSFKEIALFQEMGCGFDKRSFILL